MTIEEMHRMCEASGHGVIMTESQDRPRPWCLTCQAIVEQDASGRWRQAQIAVSASATEPVRSASEIPPNFLNAPLATRRRLIANAPIGLYRVTKDGAVVRRNEMYDVSSDTIKTGPCILVARVDDGRTHKELPVGVEMALRRQSDGCRVVMMFVPVES